MGKSSPHHPIIDQPYRITLPVNRGFRSMYCHQVAANLLNIKITQSGHLFFIVDTPPYHWPPLDRIHDNHYASTFEHGMAEPPILTDPQNCNTRYILETSAAWYPTLTQMMTPPQPLAVAKRNLHNAVPS